MTPAHYGRARAATPTRCAYHGRRTATSIRCRQSCNRHIGGSRAVCVAAAAKAGDGDAFAQRERRPHRHRTRRWERAHLCTPVYRARDKLPFERAEPRPAGGVKDRRSALTHPCDRWAVNVKPLAEARELGQRQRSPDTHTVERLPTHVGAKVRHALPRKRRDVTAALTRKMASCKSMRRPSPLPKMAGELPTTAHVSHSCNSVNQHISILAPLRRANTYIDT